MATKREHAQPASPAQAMVLSFVVLIVLGALVLSLPLCHAEGRSVAPVQALFTATSAVCVTGLAVVDTGSDYSRFGQSVILLLIQLGGLGIMLFSTAVVGLFGRRLGLREKLLIQQTSPGLSLAGVGSLARHILLFTLGCEFRGFLLLWLCWAGRLGTEAPFYALFHSISAFCNAGFGLWSDSLSSEVESAGVNLVIMALIVVGGLGYVLCRDVYLHRKDPDHRLTVHTRVALWTTLWLVLGGAVLFFLFEHSNPATLGSLGWGGKALASLFQSITTRTAGFNTISIGDVREETGQLMLMLMFVGGCPGSTAGGIKTTTFAILMLAAWSQIIGRDEVDVCERRIAVQRILQSLSLAFVAATAIMVCSLLLNYLEPTGFRHVLFETVSAMATVGLSTGITPSLSTPSMLLLCLMMFMGRVGPLTLAVSLVSQGQAHKEIRYPPADISIG